MAITKQRTLDFMEHEWGTYVERFQRLPNEVQEQRVRNMGFESFRDLLAHILAWWEEGMGVIRTIAEEREFERKKYDFDAFNAEAVAKYKPMDESQFMALFEKTCREMTADLKAMNEAVFENRRVQNWLNGIIFLHAREHLVALSRFLTLDVLQNEWSEYVEKFNKLNADKQKEFLVRQGVESFHDMLAHILGWWEEGARIITGILEKPDFKWTEHDVDRFNVILKRKFEPWSDEDLLEYFEIIRLTLIEMVSDLSDEAFLHADIEDWLATDVVEHYDEHAVPR
jgi:hypothetical protein